MNSRLLRNALHVVAVVLLAIGANLNAVAVPIIGNLNGNDGAQSADLDNGRNKGMGFTMGAQAYELDSVTLRLRIWSLASNPVVQIWSSSGSNLPAASLITLNDPALAVGIHNFVFTPGSSFTLQAATTYWLVVSGSASSDFDWLANNPGITPTGTGATHFGQQFDFDGTPPTVGSTILNSYSIEGHVPTSVPEPASAALLGLALLALRASRRRGDGSV